MQKPGGIARPKQSSALEAVSAGNARFGNRKRFRRQHRLVKQDVVALLSQGARFNLAELALKLGENPFGHARLAIAVPKRIVKSAVDRNRVKRAIREQFRQHEIRSSPVDILVTLRHIGLDKPRKHGSIRCQLRKTFAKLLGDISQRFAAPV